MLDSGQFNATAVDRATIASWRVEISLDVLTGTEKDWGKSSPSARIGQRLRHGLPGHPQNSFLHIDSLREDVSGVLTINGTVDGRVEQPFSLILKDNYTLGRFFMGQELYLLRTDPDVGVRLQRIDRTLLPQASHEDEVSSSSKTLAGSEESFRLMQAISCSDFQPGPANGNVRVLFVHTTDLVHPASVLAAGIVSDFNQSADTSGIPLDRFISVAGIRALSNNLDDRCRGSANGGIMESMDASSTPFDSLPTWMGDDYADVAIALTREDENAYIGNVCPRIGGAAITFNQYSPFAMTTESWLLADYNALHELGHVLGGVHQHGNDPAIYGSPDCGKGYEISSSQPPWFTLMGDYDGIECSWTDNQGPSGQDCVRMPIWSSPNLTYLGQTAGTSGNDMVTALQMTMPMAAALTSYPVAAPAGAPSASVQSLFCYGRNLISWSMVSGAVHYQLIQSTSSSFTTQSLAYSGQDLSAVVEMQQGQPLYLRARGCNGNGCGPWSNTVTTSYYNDCNIIP
jgi:hypothetical protein